MYAKRNCFSVWVERFGYEIKDIYGRTFPSWKPILQEHSGDFHGLGNHENTRHANEHQHGFDVLSWWFKKLRHFKFPPILWNIWRHTSAPVKIWKSLGCLWCTLVRKFSEPSQLSQKFQIVDTDSWMISSGVIDVIFDFDLTSSALLKSIPPSCRIVQNKVWLHDHKKKMLATSK